MLRSGPDVNLTWVQSLQQQMEKMRARRGKRRGGDRGGAVEGRDMRRRWRSQSTMTAAESGHDDNCDGFGGCRCREERMTMEERWKKSVAVEEEI